MNDFPDFDNELTPPADPTPPTDSVLPDGAIPAPPAPQEGTPAPVPTPAPMPKPPLTPEQKKRRRRILLGIIIVALIITGMFIASFFINLNRTAEAQVRDYLNAIADGDADRANSLVDPGISNNDRDFLTNDSLKNAEERIKILDVRELSKDEAKQRSGEITNKIPAFASQDSYFETSIDSPTSTIVEATYSLNGVKANTFFITRPGKNEKLVMHTWEILNPFIREVAINTKLTGVAIGEVNHSFDDSSLLTAIYLYPGIYNITQESTSTYLAGEEKVSVGEKNLSIDIPAKYTDALRDLVLDTVKKQYDRCASIEGNLDKVCPYAVRNKDLAELSPVTPIAEITKYDESNFTSGKGTIHIKPNPSAFIKDPPAKEIEFAFYGQIKFSAGKPEIEIYSAREYW
ncbi:hypothetical protein [Arcanobacterium buesumense]|uniref:Uncharacterized protein n=1 Tax=Arcanobacterium buesumense TaxID=2722751 RepID=A0A6H2ENB4_9ACTO|nr:hypothetical protein [Arcanobacterium buesumense]QJC22542.1 hypothetical protein HC352_08525 [Arcanobacterium buesumense]